MASPWAASASWARYSRCSSSPRCRRSGRIYCRWVSGPRVLSCFEKGEGGGGKSTADGIRWRKEWGDVGNDERAREPAVEESTRRGWTAALTGLAEQKFPVIGDYFVREIPPSDNVSPPLGADRKWG